MSYMVAYSDKNNNNVYIVYNEDETRNVVFSTVEKAMEAAKLYKQLLQTSMYIVDLENNTRVEV